MNESVRGQRPHRQGHQELQQVVVEDSVHHRDDGHAQQTNQADDEHSKETEAPHWKHNYYKLINTQKLSGFIKKTETKLKPHSEETTIIY